ncbi:MarR family winged helix-turn-helix transcriptional regulator [Acidimangrovimonas sediminis]|uniref:MarR family winged helix-turn-helix transcriptional regulator n=1 Tax=Acidimangrovimonas sediminis TaxID=2056283 RepID=UPI000C80B824|nr:MarR family winged helix-turn-helix transcriptional regulator [Acidimangrovimonas sediminis]
MNEQADKTGGGGRYPAFDLAHFTPYRMALAAQLLSETLAAQYRERYGISVADWRVLVHLAYAGKASVRDIQNRVVMDKSTISRTVSRLEERGVVSKRENPKDRRLLLLSLTEAGEAMMTDVLPMATSFQARIQAELGPQFAALEAALQSLIDAYGGGEP